MYKFQCPRCYIVSGHMSSDATDAPRCCGGVQMIPLKIQERNLTTAAGVVIPEAKLLRMPVGDAALRAQLHRFERERDCQTVGVRASSTDFAEAARLATPLALMVEEDEKVRAGHLVLVGSS